MSLQAVALSLITVSSSCETFWGHLAHTDMRHSPTVKYLLVLVLSLTCAHLQRLSHFHTDPTLTHACTPPHAQPRAHTCSDGLHICKVLPTHCNSQHSLPHPPTRYHIATHLLTMLPAPAGVQVAAPPLSLCAALPFIASNPFLKMFLRIWGVKSILQLPSSYFGSSSLPPFRLIEKGVQWEGPRWERKHVRGGEVGERTQKLGKQMGKVGSARGNSRDSWQRRWLWCF